MSSRIFSLILLLFIAGCGDNKETPPPYSPPAVNNNYEDENRDNYEDDEYDDGNNYEGDRSCDENLDKARRYGLRPGLTYYHDDYQGQVRVWPYNPSYQNLFFYFPDKGRARYFVRQMKGRWHRRR